MGSGIAQRTVCRREAGFSLIELLVVIAVMSVLAVGAVLAVGGPRAGGDLAQFREIWVRERALAIEGRDMRGLTFTAKGVQVVAWRDGGWHDIGGPKRWRGRVAFAARGLHPPGDPDIVFLSSGQSSAFSVRFSVDQADCDSDGWADLTCG
jgi:prepilin-type N-terminal cleavage/methylation domain-containing protein